MPPTLFGVLALFAPSLLLCLYFSALSLTAAVALCYSMQGLLFVSTAC